MADKEPDKMEPEKRKKKTSHLSSTEIWGKLNCLNSFPNLQVQLQEVELELKKIWMIPILWQALDKPFISSSLHAFNLISNLYKNKISSFLLILRFRNDYSLAIRYG